MTSSAQDDLENLTREQLRELARERRIAGRSSMTKAALREALQRSDAEGDSSPKISRSRWFRELAEQHAAGRIVMLPRRLSGDDRRVHVRQTLREDHEQRIAGHSEDAEQKFDKLASSLFSFFRGTALLFYRDMAGEDSSMPTVLALGDVHPGNFGVMPNAHNVPIFGVNDFDEAYYAPFTWDLKRGAVGFMIAAEELGGQGAKRRQKIARRFLRSYLETIGALAEDGGELEHEFRLDNAPPLIAELICGEAEDRAEWLADDYLDEHRRGFRSDDELIPQSGRRAEFQELLDQLVERNGIDPPARAGELRVKDVAIRRGAGTASLGLARYYMLVEGPRADGSDDLIIELKQARRSALAGLAPASGYDPAARGDRIAHAQGLQLAQGDIFYGSVDFDGMSFMSRERAPYRGDIDLDDLDKQGWMQYAGVCGTALAHVHARPDEAGEPDREIEPEILRAAAPPALLVDDVMRFAAEAVERLRADQKAFCADHELGAFSTLGVVYR